MQNSSAGCGSTTTFEAARGHRGERQCHSEKSRNLVGGDLGSICSCVRLLEDVNDNHVGTSDRLIFLMDKSFFSTLTYTLSLFYTQKNHQAILFS